MIGILLAKVKLFIRNPWTFLIMTIMSIGFALITGGTNVSTIHVPVYAADEAIRDTIVADVLNETDAYSIDWVTEEEMKDLVTNGKAELGVELQSNDFEVLVGIQSQNVDLIQQTVQRAYMKKMQYEQIENIKNDLQTAIEEPIFSIQTMSFRGADTVIVDNSLQPLLGFTLFFVIYTIAYNVFQILVEKSDGVWDRIILSPVKKWEMYTANFLYSFFTGYLQVLIIFLVFRYGVGVNFNGNFIESLLLLIPYVFAIVALAILVTGIVKTVQQFNAILPIIAVSMAMIGGAFWPLEIVESKFMIALSKVVPITYGMEVLNGVAVYGYSISELLFPISVLLLMGVIMTGVGIHLMEKRHI